MVDPPSAGDRHAAVTRAVVFGVAGAAADLDLLAGAHSGPTHGLGAAVLVGVMVWVSCTVAHRGRLSQAAQTPRTRSGFETATVRPKPPFDDARGGPEFIEGPDTTNGFETGPIGRFAVAVGLAYASHTLLDWLGSDTSPPIGIMALWPFSRDYYESRLHVFMAISRRYWLPEFWTANLAALARELAILLPAVTAVVLVRRRPTGA